MAKKLTVSNWQKELKNILSADEYTRYTHLLNCFEDTFGADREISLFSAPGRTEICGNHTDHQHGCVLAAAVDLDTVAAVSLNNTSTIRIMSEGYTMCTIDIEDLSAREGEKNTTAALIRGVASAFAALGCKIEGFDAYVISNVLRGSGLSSSAAFEVLVGVIINSLFFCSAADPVKIAQISQYAENVYFGKPSGLMDQMASSVGNLVFIDFCDPEAPAVERIDFDFSKSGHTLCVIDSGADHADLTDEYAAITREMKLISAHFGKSFLREVSESDFYSDIPTLRKIAGDRAVLRAMHFYSENKRVAAQISALKQNDFTAFLSLTTQSGRSSWMYLQNVVAAGQTDHQDVALALALCDRLLGGRGACRVHGGGFAGTVQAFVPDDMVDGFKQRIEQVLGRGSCRVLHIRPDGGKEY